MYNVVKYGLIGSVGFIIGCAWKELLVAVNVHQACDKNDPAADLILKQYRDIGRKIEEKFIN